MNLFEQCNVAVVARFFGFQTPCSQYLPWLPLVGNMSNRRASDFLRLTAKQQWQSSHQNQCNQQKLRPCDRDVFATLLASAVKLHCTSQIFSQCPSCFQYSEFCNVENATATLIYTVFYILSDFQNLPRILRLRSLEALPAKVMCPMFLQMHSLLLDKSSLQNPKPLRSVQIRRTPSACHWKRLKQKRKAYTELLCVSHLLRQLLVEK